MKIKKSQEKKKRIPFQAHHKSILSKIDYYYNGCISKAFLVFVISCYHLKV